VDVLISVLRREKEQTLSIFCNTISRMAVEQGAQDIKRQLAELAKRRELIEAEANAAAARLEQAAVGMHDPLVDKEVSGFAVRGIVGHLCYGLKCFQPSTQLFPPPPPLLYL
jgi:hypothetical protein